MVLFTNFIFIFLIFTSCFIRAEEATYIQALLPQSVPTETSIVSDNTTNIVSPISLVIEGTSVLTEADIFKNTALRQAATLTDLQLSRIKKTIRKRGIFKRIATTYDAATRVLSVTVEENPKIGHIDVKGNSLYNEAFLKSQLRSKVGQPVNVNHIRSDLSFFEALYEKDGYFEGKVTRIERPYSDGDSLVFHVSEGIIQDIEITGNIKTKDYVILREIDVRPGQRLNRKEIELLIRKVFNLNYFEQVVPDIIPTQDDGYYTLRLQLKERATSGSFSFGGGYQPRSGFNLFSDLYWDNLMGTGQLIVLRGNFGLGTGDYDNRNNTYQFKYQNPWAFGKHRSFAFKLWSQSGSFDMFNLQTSQYGFKETRRKGLEFEFGVPLSYDLRTYHRTKYESIAIPDNNIAYNLYTYTFLLSHDKRDQRLNPTTGTYHTFSVEQAFKFRPRAVDLTRFDLTLRRYLPVFKKQVVFLKSTFGYLRSPDIDNEDMFNNEYYFVGGSNSVRGYEDNRPFAYGNKQIIATMEYRYLFTQNVMAYLFIDTGYASKFRQSGDTFTAKNYRDLSEYKLTKGVGTVFILQPLGPIRLDFGITERGVGRLQFNVGYSF